MFTDTLDLNIGDKVQILVKATKTGAKSYHSAHRAAQVVRRNPLTEVVTVKFLD